MSLDLLTAWRGLLGDLANHGDALCAAIEADDVVAAIATMMQLRRVRSALARVEGTGALRGDEAELEAMREVAALTLRTRAAEAAMQSWLGRTLPGDMRLLGSALGVAVLADSLLPAVWDFESDLVVLVGGGLEPVAELLAAVGQRRIIVLGGDASRPVAGAIGVEAQDELAAAVRMLVPGPPQQMVLRGALGADPDEVQRAADTVRDALSDLRIHRNTVQVFSRTWLEQGIANLGGLARWPSVATLDRAFVGVPMVIVAPGPSLAKNADQLRGLRGRAIITAFSHSLKPVLAAGVVPDLVITVDPQDVRYHFAGCDLGATCLVNAATVHPSLFELPAARGLTLSANCSIDDWIFDGLGEEALVPGGGSVATSAFSLGLRWGCDPIVFVGLDLSFPGGEYYVATSSDGAARARVDERGIMRVEGWSDGFRAMKAGGGPTAPIERAIELPGWHGDRVPSSFMFSLFHRWFVDRMRSVGETTVYNCTEGGVFIEGMVHRPLAEVAPLLRAPVDAGAVIDAAIAGVDGDARLRKLAAHVGGYVHGLRRARKLAAKARALVAAGDPGGQLTRVERALATTLRPLGFVSLLAQREVERAHDVARRDGTTGGFLAASDALFASLASVVNELEPALTGALARMRGRPHGRAA